MRDKEKYMFRQRAKERNICLDRERKRERERERKRQRERKRMRQRQTEKLQKKTERGNNKILRKKDIKRDIRL